MVLLLELMKKNKALTAVVLINILFLSFFFYYNCRTGFFIDDYGYMYIFSEAEKLTDERVSSIGDVVSSQLAHYNIMNGRLVTHTVLQTVLMLGKGVFNLLNTFFYGLLAFSMYQLVRKKDGHSPLVMAAVYLLPWVLFTEFGKVFLVQCMAVNYLWSMAAMLLMLTVFRRLYDGEDIFSDHPAAGAVIMGAAGIVTGWLSENGSAAMLFAVGCMGLYYLIARKKIPAWCFAGFGGMCLGFLMMITAPGYDVRSEEYMPYSYTFRMMQIIVYNILPYYWLILAALVMLGCLLYFRREQSTALRVRFSAILASAAVVVSLLCAVMPESVESECRIAVILAAAGVSVWLSAACIKEKKEIKDLAPAMLFMLTGIVATCVMVASPVMEKRSELQFLLYYICGTVFVAYRLLDEVSQMLGTDIISRMLLAAMLMWSVISLSAAVPAVNDGYEQFRAREAYIEEQKYSGNLDITLPAYEIPENNHVGIYNSVNSDPDYWVNKAICWYYGINSVSYAPAQENES